MNHIQTDISDEALVTAIRTQLVLRKDNVP